MELVSAFPVLLSTNCTINAYLPGLAVIVDSDVPVPLETWTLDKVCTVVACSSRVTSRTLAMPERAVELRVTVTE